jgi:hypothetical protein
MRKPIFIHTLLLALATTSAPARDQHGVVLDIADRNQIFIDERFLLEKQNVRIVVCPPEKTREKCLIGKGMKVLRGYGNIMAVDGVFRGFDALSKDGSHWRRVRKGTQPEPDDIVGYVNGQAVVFTDPIAPPEQRYKLANPQLGGVQASADGAKWQTMARGIFPAKARYPRGMDSQNVIFYDGRIKKYVAYVRVNQRRDAPPERRDYFDKLSQKKFRKPGSYSLRNVGRCVTDDLSSFPMPEVVFGPDERDPRFGGVGVMDFYMPNVIQYEHAQDAYFLFSPRYLHYEDWYLSEDLSAYPKSGADTLNTGPEDIGFAASRDGIEWQRYQRKPWISLGMEGSFDSGNMYPVRGMIVREREIWMYYTGYDTLHGDVDFKQRMKPVLSRVVLRKDGFTAVEAEYKGGQFTTPPLRFQGDALHLNIDTSALGLARVEIQDVAGQPIDGFTLEDCDRIHTANTVDRVVTWRRGQSSVAQVQGQPVRLRFELRFGARLYAFQFTSKAK